MPTYRVFDTSNIPTTEDLLNEFLVNMVSTAQGVTDIAIGSKMWALGYTTSKQLASIYYTLHFYRKQSFVLTATGKYLDLHGIEVGTMRQTATKATGEVTFYRDAPAPIDIIIPAATVVNTPVVSSNSPTLKFITVDDVIIKIGETEAVAFVECLSTGEIGNLPAGSISTIDNILPGAQRVTSGTTSGGQEIEDDDSYRERILTAWKGRETGTAAAIRSAVLSVAGIRNVMIVDPARNRIRQTLTINSQDTNKEQLQLTTLSPLEAKYDILSSFLGTTLTLQQLSEKGEVISEEIVPDVTSGWDLLDKINSWSQSGTIYLNNLFLDDNPYDDPIKQATDNEIVFVRTIAPSTAAAMVSLVIEDIPVIEDDETETMIKRLVVSTQTQYYHNQILGQTETSPLIEVFEGFTTYSEMVATVNDTSRLIKMVLLDIKTATETLNPEPYMSGENIIKTSFTPITEIVLSEHEDIRIIDANEGIIGVGQIASPLEFVYKYKAKTVDGEIEINFGEKKVENLVLSLITDGSELVSASPVLTPDMVANIDLNFCDEMPASFDGIKMKSIFKIARGRVDVTIIPYSLTEIPDPILLDKVIAAIEKVKPAGVEVNLIYPNTRLIDISLSVEVITNSEYEPSQFYDIIKTNITNYINSLEMGETAYFEKIITAANPAVAGLKVAHLRTPTADITTASTSFLRAGSIYFNTSENQFTSLVSGN